MVSLTVDLSGLAAQLLHNIRYFLLRTTNLLRNKIYLHFWNTFPHYKSSECLPQQIKGVRSPIIRHQHMYMCLLI